MVYLYCILQYKYTIYFKLYIADHISAIYNIKYMVYDLSTNQNILIQIYIKFLFDSDERGEKAQYPPLNTFRTLQTTTNSDQN